MIAALPPLAIWIGIIGIMACALFAGLRIFEWSQVFQPRRHVARTPRNVNLAFEDLHFVAEDGVLLHGWWLPQPQAPGTLIYLHGSGGNLGEKLETVRGLHGLGWHLFAFDYRGYGQSRGITTEQGTYRDARAAYELVRAQYDGSDDPPVVLFGRSLGGAIAIRLAMDKPVAGLIVEASFTSIADMALCLHPNLPIRRFGSVHYPSIERVPLLRMPKLFAHSREDELIPYAQGQALFGAAAEPKQFLELRGLHGDHPWVGTPGYWSVMRTFLNRIRAS